MLKAPSANFSHLSLPLRGLERGAKGGSSAPLQPPPAGKLRSQPPICFKRPNQHVVKRIVFANMPQVLRRSFAGSRAVFLFAWRPGHQKFGLCAGSAVLIPFDAARIPDSVHQKAMWPELCGAGPRGSMHVLEEARERVLLDPVHRPLFGFLNSIKKRESPGLGRV